MSYSYDRSKDPMFAMDYARSDAPKYADLRDEITRLRTEVQRQKDCINAITEQNAKLIWERDQIPDIRVQEAALVGENMILKAENEALRRDVEQVKDWVCHNGGLLNEWAKEWFPSKHPPLTKFIRAKLDAAMGETK